MKKYVIAMISVLTLTACGNNSKTTDNSSKENQTTKSEKSNKQKQNKNNNQKDMKDSMSDKTQRTSDQATDNNDQTASDKSQVASTANNSNETNSNSTTPSQANVYYQGETKVDLPTTNGTINSSADGTVYWPAMLTINGVKQSVVASYTRQGYFEIYTTQPTSKNYSFSYFGDYQKYIGNPNLDEIA